MRSVKSLVAAGAASLFSTMAFAADMPSIMPPPPMAYAPPPVEDFGGWYLRGDIGFSNQRVSRLNNALDVNNTTSVQNLGFNTAGIFGLGVGYRVNNWFRADITGEYRGNSQFFGTDQITYPGGVGTDTYHATKSEWLVLANAYVDLGTWWCITPFIGAGVGTARVSIANFTDQGIANNGAGALPGLALARQRLEMEPGLGAACRCCLQGQPELHGRTRLSLPQYGRWPDRRLADVRRHQCHRQSDDLQEHHLA